MRTRLLALILVVGVAVIGAAPAVTTAASVVNGGFETGNFAGWTVVNQPGGTGDWYVYTGTASPLMGFPIAAPPEGTHAASTDQTGPPGSHVLYQDVPLEAGFAHTLSFTVYYSTGAGLFVTPPTLDYTVNLNEQYRVDIVRPSAAVTSVAPSDVLATVFQTAPDDPNSLAPTTISFDLTPFAGTTVRIRFAEVDNITRTNIQASADAVAITSRSLLPTSKHQCKNGGWRNFPVFKNQGDCVSFVASKGKNPRAGH